MPPTVSFTYFAYVISGKNWLIVTIDLGATYIKYYRSPLSTSNCFTIL